eukprot:194384-Prymnesium_polylepis.1
MANRRERCLSKRVICQPDSRGNLSRRPESHNKAGRYWSHVQQRELCPVASVRPGPYGCAYPLWWAKVSRLPNRLKPDIFDASWLMRVAAWPCEVGWQPTVLRSSEGGCVVCAAGGRAAGRLAGSLWTCGGDWGRERGWAVANGLGVLPT